MKLSTIASAIGLAIAVTGTAYAAPDTVNVKIININDFHGQLESPGNFRDAAGAATIPVGGIDYLAGYFAHIKSKNPNTAILSAGDLIGATPLISGSFHDEPTIETMNMAGLEINGVGNHEFDKGKDELLRMQYGGCHPTSENSCQGIKAGTDYPFTGAKFKFLAANVIDEATGKTLFPPYIVKHYDGVKVGFIGMTLRETPSIVTPSGVAGLRFIDEARATNTAVRQMRRQGVRAIVALIHQGGTIPVPQNAATINRCDGNLDGSPIRRIVARLSPAVDIVLTGHTHQAYNCMLPNSRGRLIPVTGANSIGRVLTEIDMEINKNNGVVRSVTANNVLVDRNNPDITPNARIKQIVDNYKTIAAPIANRVIGSITNTLSRTANAAGEQVMGNIIADSQLAATQAPEFGSSQVAFMNPGGVRADMTFASSTVGEGDGNVTYAEAFTVQPFGNSLVTMTLTGAQIETLLEQQFTGCANDLGATQPFNRILLPSAGFRYSWNAAGGACAKVDPASISLNGVTVNPANTYRVTVNSFLASGGDNFTVLRQGTDPLGGAQDIDALAAYFAAHSPIAPVALDRITRLP